MIDTIVLSAGAAVLLTGAGLLIRSRSRLVGTFLCAAGLFGLVGGWLLAEGTSTVDAVKTGGLAGGAVVALYALWLNDRRRRVEEDRHDLESRKADYDRERVADERFARSVELLGHAADQVRVGAMHAMVGLARSRPTYTQTVLDVLCAYLRRPFAHPAFDLRPDDPDRADVRFSDVWPVERIAEANREREVRRTAQGLIAELVPRRDGHSADRDPDRDAPRYDLDLTAATLEYFGLRDRDLGRLVARRARLLGGTRLRGLRVLGSALLSAAEFGGRLDLHGARFVEGLSLRDVTLRGTTDLSDVVIGEFAKLQLAEYAEIDATGMRVPATSETTLPAGWHVEPSAEPGGGLGVIVREPTANW